LKGHQIRQSWNRYKRDIAEWSVVRSIGAHI
jgi:hypothetical protein